MSLTLELSSGGAGSAGGGVGGGDGCCFRGDVLVGIEDLPALCLRRLGGFFTGGGVDGGGGVGGLGFVGAGSVGDGGGGGLVFRGDVLVGFVDLPALCFRDLDFCFFGGGVDGGGGGGGLGFVGDCRGIRVLAAGCLRGEGGVFNGGGGAGGSGLLRDDDRGDCCCGGVGFFLRLIRRPAPRKRNKTGVADRLFILVGRF
jgi:hypothetical protein